MSDSLWPLGLQHTRLPCPSPSPRVFSNSCPLSQWCPPTISFSVSPFSCSLSFPATGSFPVSWLFSSGGQSIGASVSILPMNIQSQEDPLEKRMAPIFLPGQFHGQRSLVSAIVPRGSQRVRHHWVTNTLDLWDLHFILSVLIVVVCIKTGSELLDSTFPTKLKTWILSTSHNVRGQVSASKPYWISPT